MKDFTNATEAIITNTITADQSEKLTALILTDGLDEITIRPCTAVPVLAGGTETDRQDALLVTFRRDGCMEEAVVFGWDITEIQSREDWKSMCEDSIAWDMDAESSLTTVVRYPSDRLTTVYLDDAE